MPIQQRSQLKGFGQSTNEKYIVEDINDLVAEVKAGRNLEGTNYVFVATDGTSSENGLDLVTAYNNAIIATPNGLPLSKNNRYTILLASGKYQLPSPLSLTTEYVDLVSITGQKDVFITASSTPLLVLTDNIKLVGISVQQYDLTILYELNNIIVVNSGNNLYTINRDVKKEEKQYYYSWSVTSGEPYPLASTAGLVTYLNIDNTTYANTNKYMNFNMAGSVRLKDTFVYKEIGGNLYFSNEEQVGQSTNNGFAIYDTLVGTLNVGDTLEFSGPSGTFTAQALYVDGTIIGFSLTSGIVYGDETSLLDLTSSATANVTTIAFPLGFYGNAISNNTISTGSGQLVSTALSINSAAPGICSVIFKGEPQYQAFVVFSGNPFSFNGDATITNNLGGTASIGINSGANFLYLSSLSGTWDGATTITGNVSSNTRNITKFSDTWELNIKTQLLLNSYSNSNIL